MHCAGIMEENRVVASTSGPEPPGGDVWPLVLAQAVGRVVGWWGVMMYRCRRGRNRDRKVRGNKPLLSERGFFLDVKQLKNGVP